MNKYFKKITEYFNEENIYYEYDENDNSLTFDLTVKEFNKKLRSFILDFNEIFQVNIGTIIKDDVFTSQNNTYKISEYIHRANLGMIRGNFEYDIDRNIIVFKHYFEKTSVMDKKYAMSNILLPTAMFIKYLDKLYKLVNTSISPKELIDEIESENNQSDG